MYRGKRIDGQGWEYGYFVRRNEVDWHGEPEFRFFIYTGDWEECFEIDPASVGQWTGRYDKNGTEIYTNSKLKCGDIVGFINTDVGIYDFVESEPYKDYEPYSVCFGCLMDESPNNVEVITDNPELLTGDLTS